MQAMMLARRPDFVEQEGAKRFDRAVEIVRDAPLFAASGADQGTEFSLKQRFLPRFRAQDHDQGYGVFRELSGSGWAGFASRCAFLSFGLGHSGGIVPQDAAERRARQCGPQRW